MKLPDVEKKNIAICKTNIIRNHTNGSNVEKQILITSTSDWAYLIKWKH